MRRYECGNGCIDSARRGSEKASEFPRVRRHAVRCHESSSASRQTKRAMKRALSLNKQLKSTSNVLADCGHPTARWWLVHRRAQYREALLVEEEDPACARCAATRAMRSSVLTMVARRHSQATQVRIPTSLPPKFHLTGPGNAAFARFQIGLLPLTSTLAITWQPGASAGSPCDATKPQT